MTIFRFWHYVVIMIALITSGAAALVAGNELVGTIFIVPGIIMMLGIVPARFSLD